MRWLIVVAFTFLAACGGDSHLCGAGTCTDPSLPYCDVDGTIAGEPHICIAVACTPGEVTACRGDTAVVCNQDGTSFDDVACANGCDHTLPGGCRLCDANRTVCTSDIVETCNNAGEVIAVDHCELGCNATVPRCNAIDPSNGLGSYADQIANPVDFILTDAVFNTIDGTVTANGGQAIDIPSFPAGTAGGAIWVFVVRSLTLTNATIGQRPTADDIAGPALAIVSRGPITLAGTIVVWPTGDQTAACQPAGDGMTATAASSGGGGGANATDGADGGEVIGTLAGGAKDVSSGTPALVPLHGGCRGALRGSLFSNGGGALQLASSTKITIDAILDLHGQDGIAKLDSTTSGVNVGGGGAGGSLLLEAPTVWLTPNAALLLAGGNGFHCSAANCGTAGTGATRTSPATAGGSVPLSTNATAGGGGGGLGRVRINTKTGGYTRSPTTIEDAQVTTSTVEVR